VASFSSLPTVPNPEQAFPLPGKLLIQALLRKNLRKRLGKDVDYNSIMSHAFFSNISWEDVEDQRPGAAPEPPPFRPCQQKHWGQQEEKSPSQQGQTEPWHWQGKR